MSISQRIKRALRGRVSASEVVRETARQGSVSLRESYQRLAGSSQAKATLSLTAEFSALPPAELLTHFRERVSPRFFNGFHLKMETLAPLQRELYPAETEALIGAARDVSAHRWPLLDYGALDFGTSIDWLREPVSKIRWSLDHYRDVPLIRGDGSDIRVLWELNRLGHLLTLGRAFAITGDETFAEEFFKEIESWQEQNSFGYGPNWTCAMEVALRATNLLAAMQMFRRAACFSEARCSNLLGLLQQHGDYIRQNLEFSYLGTSNHYLCDVTGLLWLGVMLPELQASQEWREFGLRELLSEMDKQILSDGADYEASTGYHRLKTELFLYSFVLCHLNEIDVPEKFWNKLGAMLGYERACLRPDGRAPLIGDADSSQFLPLARHAADDHAYLLALGAAVFREPKFKISLAGETPELFWLLGEEGARDYAALPAEETVRSQAFPDAGTYVLRDGDLYLLFNASGNGLNGRGSHGHNDALSIEVSACGSAFIIDPGSYVYTSDLPERHRFRSTAYHSTVQVDDVEQNTTNEHEPFVLGDEAHPRVTRCDFSDDTDIVVAEHDGYARLKPPVTHRRIVEFNRRDRFWLIQDEVEGSDKHTFHFRFHFAPELEIKVRNDGAVEAHHKAKGAGLLVLPQGIEARAELDDLASSHDYGHKVSSVSARWSVTAKLPLSVRFKLVPICPGEDELIRLSQTQI